MNKSSIREANAVWLLDWLLTRSSDELPRLKEIGPLMPHRTDSYGAWDVLRTLHSSRRIDWRSGTVSENRGHQAVRLKTGRVLKTAGCPFEPGP